MPSMICKERNLAFLHFSKTGGWFVTRMLRTRGFVISDMQVWGGHIGVDGFDPSLTRFGFIRHPVSWYRSLFNYFTNCNWSNGHDFSYLTSDNLDEFIGRCADSFDLMKLYKTFYGVDTNEEADFIFRFEDMHSVLPEFLSNHGIDCFDYINKNKGNQVNKSKTQLDDSCSIATQSYIYETCHPIFERFEYEKRDPRDS